MIYYADEFIQSLGFFADWYNPVDPWLNGGTFLYPDGKFRRLFYSSDPRLCDVQIVCYSKCDAIFYTVESAPEQSSLAIYLFRRFLDHVSLIGRRLI